jgi:hypothetical protein
MKLFELAQNIEEFKDVDLVDDLLFFMHNDPAFYRKVLFPRISDMKSTMKAGGECGEMHFKPCVDKAVGSYCNKFKIQQEPNSLFSKEELSNLAEKMFHQEKENIEKDVYK